MVSMMDSARLTVGLGSLLVLTSTSLGSLAGARTMLSVANCGAIVEIGDRASAY